MKVTINNRYMALQGLYWMLFCIPASFISLYLQGRGLSNGGIGTVTAIFGIMAALLQPVLGGITDRSRQLTWRSMTLMLAIPFLLICIIMPLIPGAWAGAIFMGLLILLGNTIMPFINSAHFYYTHAGETINFGVARGIGSGMYAILALLIGFLAEKYGIEMVPISGILIVFLFILVVFRMPTKKKVVEPAPKEVALQKGFIHRYPAFNLMLLATLMMLSAHSILNTYLLQIIQSVGGNSSQLGIAVALQAVVEVPVLFGFSRLIKRFRSKTLMLVAATGFAFKALMYALSGSVSMIYMIQLAQMFSYAIFASSSVYYTSEMVSKEDQNTGQAYLASMMGVGAVLGSLSGGWILELSGMTTMLSVNVIIAMVGVLFAILSFKNKAVHPNR
ncbi:MAG TPA: MFS transporter [Anaerolineaceae bacterium]|nr:MFS transporter [Anaerolineaceae bacterium]